VSCQPTPDDVVLRDSTHLLPFVSAGKASCDDEPYVSDGHSSQKLLAPTHRRLSSLSLTSRWLWTTLSAGVEGGCTTAERLSKKHCYLDAIAETLDAILFDVVEGGNNPLSPARVQVRARAGRMLWMTTTKSKLWIQRRRRRPPTSSYHLWVSLMPFM
jgi:hypothetical protein